MLEYKTPELEIVIFDTEDVIATSDWGGGEIDPGDNEFD